MLHKAPAAVTASLWWPLWPPAAATTYDGDSETTLTVDVFGQFGYEELYQQYEASHPT